MNVRRVHIKNFKSIVDLSLDLAPINVFIGENGSGKSNILEALAFTAAAAAEAEDLPISIDLEAEGGLRGGFEINTSGDATYPKWSSKFKMEMPGALAVLSNNELAELIAKQLAIKDPDEIQELAQFLERPSSDVRPPVITDNLRGMVFQILVASLKLQFGKIPLADFIIYSPEITALRTFEKEGQILPLGVRGEGLLKLLRVLASEDETAWVALQHNLELLDWLSGIDIDHENSFLEQSLRLRDRFVSKSLPPFDQRSANEGFLYLLFFFALVLSKTTPRFFAIENIDTSLNPKACSELMRRLTLLIVERQKQVLLTTHNPSVLDGLNLHDEDQRLFVVFRNKHGHTVARRVTPPQPIGDELPIRLSEAFMRGLLGGIPQNF